MLNVYEQVSRNKAKSGLIIAIFVIFILLVSYLITQYANVGNGLILYALGFSTTSCLVSFFAGDKIILSLNHARPASREEFFNFYTTTENLAAAARLPIPKIYVINSPAPNAFATGRDPQHATICATTGLLSKLNRTQLEGVIAHELSHIKNYDIRLMMIVSVLVGSLAILIRTGSHNPQSRSQKNNRSGIFALIGLLFLILSPIIAKLIQLAISRRREYLADASAVKLTRQPQGLISALKIISQDPNILDSASTATASLYISNPFKNNKVANLFSTHPPIEKRIATLQQML